MNEFDVPPITTPACWRCDQIAAALRGYASQDARTASDVEDLIAKAHRLNHQGSTVEP